MITLRGKTRHGKNRVFELGSQWNIVKTAESVLFSDKRGPWALVEPVEDDPENNRWILLEGDTDFEVVKQ